MASGSSAAPDLRSAAAMSAAGSSRRDQVRPWSVVSRRARHAPPEAQGALPSAQPMLVETKVTEPGSKPAPDAPKPAAAAAVLPLAAELAQTSPTHAATPSDARHPTPQGYRLERGNRSLATGRAGPREPAPPAVESGPKPARSSSGADRRANAWQYS